MSDKQKNILILEDEVPLANAIQDKFKKHGIKTVTSRSVDDALEKMSGSKFDAIWLDHYLLGKKDGLSFVKTIKDKFGSIPIFVISNTASQEKIDQYLSLGVQKYYIKAEARLEDLVQEVKKYVKSEKV